MEKDRKNEPVSDSGLEESGWSGLDKNTRDMIYLASCAVNRRIPQNTEEMDIDGIYAEAQRHLMTSLISFALESAGIMNARTKACIAAASRRTVIMEAEKAALFQKLEAAGIWYMPLKGAVLKDYYPRFGMREMADYDILFDVSRSDEVKAIMENLGFTTKEYHTKSNHDVYIKKPVTRFEMHRSLFGVFHESRLASYYADIKKHLVKDSDNAFGYHFTPEDFYVYMVAHEYKHYSRGGTGIRSLLDVYVFLKRFQDLNWLYIREQTELLGTREFEEKNRKLAMALFDGEQTDEAEMLAYMAKAGVFGTVKNQIENGMKARQCGKAGYIRRRIFLPMSIVERAYPFFSRHRLLLPFLPLYRVYLYKKRGHSNVKAELEALLRRSGSEKEEP